MLWVLVSSFILWLVNFLPVNSEFHLGSYLIYAIMLFMGGFVFHFLTEMIAAPATEDNWGQWGQLALQLIFATLGILSVFGTFYIEKYLLKLHGVLTLGAILIAIWVVIGHAEKAHNALNGIKGG